jgi:hypothetical protein
MDPENTSKEKKKKKNKETRLEEVRKRKEQVK